MRRIVLVLVTFLLIMTLFLSTQAEVVIVSPDEQEEPITADSGLVLKPGEQYKEDGDYAIEFDQIRLRSDDTLNQGLFRISYLTSDKDGEPLTAFEYTVGTHMPSTINWKFTNFTMGDMAVLKRVKCQLIYDDIYVFDTMATQVNPNQTTSGGNTGYGSTVGRLVEPLVSVNLRFFVSIPIPIRDSSKSLVAVLTIDNNESYVVDLRSSDAIEID